jgi:hypothetical protein
MIEQLNTYILQHSTTSKGIIVYISVRLKDEGDDDSVHKVTIDYLSWNVAVYGEVIVKPI